MKDNQWAHARGIQALDKLDCGNMTSAEIVADKWKTNNYRLVWQIVNSLQRMQTGELLPWLKPLGWLFSKGGYSRR